MKNAQIDMNTIFKIKKTSLNCFFIYICMPDIRRPYVLTGPDRLRDPTDRLELYESDRLTDNYSV